MSEGKGFFARIFGGGDAVLSEGETRIYSASEVGSGGRRREEPAREIEQHPHGFTVERAAQVIKDLPPDVSKESAYRIVRGTLTAAGIRFDDLERSTRARETRLRSEIGLARDRQGDLKDRTEEVIRSLEDDIRKAREACENGVAEEEEKVARSNSGLEEIQMVRNFFGFPGADSEETTGSSEALVEPAGDETQVIEPVDADVDRTQVLGRPPLSEPDETPEER